MVNDKTQKKVLPDVKLSFSLQIPQGHNLEINFDQSQCNFYLNQKVVEEIQAAKKQGISLEVPPRLLMYLWYCICLRHNYIPDIRLKNNSRKITKNYFGFLLNILKILRSKTLQRKLNLQISSTFNSYYKQDKLTVDDAHENDCILQSIVLFNGDVLQKVKEDFLLYNPQCSMVISAHYWLVGQLLNSLRNQFKLLLWELSSLFPAGLVVSKISLIHGMNLVQRTVLLIIIWLSIAVLIFACRNFLFRILKRNIAIKYQYLNWIAWVMSCLIPAIAIIYTKNFQAIIDTIFLAISVCIPLLLQPILRFIWPRLGKIIVRRFL
ncbi:hypothetical protein CLI64_03170 [Nostoc sp. CENA543]|uniref:hypothetical protein n=1 Tax=Nostoc sp. CENA543 TaxID=1869241 RepID=UPI000CA2227D|nr:hypothetical protein [Nostoc sp. CENA543]AUS99470.1 hypothetical protein CLI64_03170 [Nostoc sp. CENA543]